MKTFIKSWLDRVHKGQALLCAFACSFFFAVAVPLQTFRGNAEMFDYGVSDLLPELAVVWIAVLAFAFFVQVATEPFMGRLAHLGFVAITLFGYLEAGILSVGLPQLNGELWLFCRPSIRQYLDLWLFCGMVIASLVFRKRLYSCLHWIALSVILMSGASIFDVGGVRETTHNETVFDSGFCPVNDMVNSIEFSTNKNVIVVIVDSAPADMLDQVMCENPALQARFPGFTAFPANISMHDNTTRAMPAMFTGKYLEKDISYFDNIASFWGEESALNAYLTNGFDMYVHLIVGDSYTNRRKSFTTQTRPSSSKIALLRYTRSEPFINLRDIVAFRLMFFRRKHWVMVNAMRWGLEKVGRELHPLTREWDLYPLLDSIPVSKDGSANVFCLFHTEGVHIPIIKDGNGVDLQVPDSSRGAIKAYLPYIMEYVAGFMDSLRAKNVYDNSFIVIAADHGILYDAKSAMLWVKPVGEKGAYNVNMSPTSHSQIASLLKEAVNRNIGIDEIVTILSQKKRLLRIRQSSPDKWWQFGRTVDTYDIFFDESGNEISRKNLGEFKVN